METSSTRVYGPLLFLFFFFLSVFIFFSFLPPFFFVSRRDRSTSVSFCSPPFFFIYLPFSPYNHPRTNEERTITFCFRLEDLLPPEPLDSSSVFCLHFNRPSATFHANILASSNNIVPLVSFHAPCALASWIYPNTCNQLEYHRWRLWPCDFSSFPPPVHMIARSFLSSPRLIFHPPVSGDVRSANSMFFRVAAVKRRFNYFDSSPEWIKI